MTVRDRWLDEGLAVLVEQGVGGVRVDRIARRLELTKGSFHHHFDGIDDFHLSLLARYEADAMAAIEAALAAVAGLAADAALMQLPGHVAFDPRLEAAIRGWALGSVDARAVQARVDAARLDALTGLWQRILPDPAGARTAALVPHLLMIGASMALPTSGEHDVADAFALLARLVPAVRETASAGQGEHRRSG